MKNEFMVKALRLTAYRLQFIDSCSSLTAFLIPRFLIPDSRFCMPKAIMLLTVMLLLTITFPLHATTPGFDTLVNYDTAWTYIYNGGIENDGSPIPDDFYDVKAFPDGTTYCVGSTADSTLVQNRFR